MSGEKWVLIVDDAAFMRSMLKKVIAGENGFRVLEAPDGAQALKLYQEYRPGLVLLDISMPGIDLIYEITEIFQMHNIETEIIAASIRNPIHVIDCAKAGADIATVPYKVLEQMTKHPLTDQGIAKFQADYRAVFGE